MASPHWCRSLRYGSWAAFSVLFRNVWIVGDYANNTVSRITSDTNSALKSCQTKRVGHFACFWEEITETDGRVCAQTRRRS